VAAVPVPVPVPKLAMLVCPEQLHRIVKQTRRLAVRQMRSKLTVNQAVGENINILFTGVIYFRTPVNVHLRQNAPDELPVRSPPLSDTFS